MRGFFSWLGSIFFGVINGVAKVVMALVLLVVALIVIALIWGDGLPSNMVLAMDLRDPVADSAPAGLFSGRRLTMMDVVLGLDAAGRDPRVKGVVMKLGNGSLSSAQGEEIAAAVQRFRSHDKFVIAQSSAFFSGGLGDYVAASAANEIWMQPKAPFGVAGTGGGEIFLRGLLDKVQAVPQIAKRAEYKSAADMYMEKSMSEPDREQLTRLMQSAYDEAVTRMAAGRHITKPEVVTALEASPQFSEDALKAKLIDRIGYDDEAKAASEARAGSGTKTVKMTDYRHDASPHYTQANIAIIQAAGEIRDGTAKNSLLGNAGGIASDDLSAAILEAARDKNIKAIVLRVDSPGGSVTASDQILHAVNAAQKAGKPVVVSMGSVAASGGYYISLSANKIIAEPGTITGSIGVLTGKVSFNKTADWAGIGTGVVSVGKNALMDSPLQPYTDDQWANLNHQADVIYDDFTHKVAEGRKLPLDKVHDIARGRVWSGADARDRGLVDSLGGFWTAAGEAASLGHVAATDMSFRTYPRPTGFWGRLESLSGGLDASIGLFGRIESLMNLPAAQALQQGLSSLPPPGSGVSLQAGNLPRP